MTVVGVPKEIKNSENRVALTPAGASEFVKCGHTVYVQSSAGVGSGYSDEEYLKAGAKILPSIDEVYAAADMILKVSRLRHNFIFFLDILYVLAIR